MCITMILYIHRFGWFGECTYLHNHVLAMKMVSFLKYGFFMKVDTMKCLKHNLNYLGI